MGAITPDSHATPRGTPSPGDLIDGKYRIARVLGQGSMGSVVAAHHELLDLDVAVKVLSSELLRDEKAVERFMREARAVARLKSEHVARVMDVGMLGNGQPYIVMELLEGEDLDDMLRRTGPFPVARTVDFALQALEALAQAHAAGVVHRDLKPANIFLTSAPDGREVIKVLDFGVAKLTERPAPGSSVTGLRALTGEHAAVGSPGFMSPEQVRCSRDIDERADIWGMGALLYEVLTERPAFDGQSLGEIFGAILHIDPRPLRSLRPDVPRALEAAIMRCLRRRRLQRFQSVGELAEAIAPFGSRTHREYPARITRTLARGARASHPDTPVPPNPTPRSGSATRWPDDTILRDTLLDAAATQRSAAHRPRRRRRGQRGLRGRWATAGAGLTLVALASTSAFVRGSPRWSPPAAGAAAAASALDQDDLAVARAEAASSAAAPEASASGSAPKVPSTSGPLEGPRVSDTSDRRE
jgi:serine/threonine-protein kinase